MGGQMSVVSGQYHGAMRFLFLAIVTVYAAWASPAFGVEPSAIKSDETILFFPTAARLTDDGKHWIVPIHGWIFEQEQGDLLRGAAVEQIRRAVGDAATEGERQILEQRLRLFLVDNERSKRVQIALAGEFLTLPASAENGHFEDTVSVPVERADRFAEGGILKVRAVLSEIDSRHFGGSITLLPQEGVTVISDIDDTVKVTNVTDLRAMMRKTFLEDFEAVPGMSSRYVTWANEGAHVHFLSGSPWQLQREIAFMLHRGGFPAGTFQLRAVRFKDSSVLQLLQPPTEFKTTAIEATFARWPTRRYVLVGDSGEHDPEVYGEIARRFPDRVLFTAIRDVTDENRDADRYRTAFRDVPAERWMIFTDPGRLPSLSEIEAIGTRPSK
jgi:phosphatidate phosphatase APP1